MTDGETLAASIEGNLCVIRLQRPDVLNAFDYDMLLAFRRAVDDAARVRRREALAEAEHDREELRGAQPASSLEARRERPARDPREQNRKPPSAGHERQEKGVRQTGRPGRRSAPQTR